MYAFLTKHALLILGLVFLFTYSSVVSSSREPALPEESAPTLSVVGEPEEVSAAAYSIFDLKTGTVLASENVEEVRRIASVTKLATAAVVATAADIDEEVSVNYADTTAEGRAGKLSSGDLYTKRELLFPLLLESSNDAATVFERTAERDLVTAMNELATAAGMEDTTFADASGLSDRNVSTATDLQRLLTHVYEDYPYVLDITRLDSYVGPHTSLVNNSPVLDEGYLGGKHGFTEAANRTLASLFNEEIGGETHIIGYVLLGSDNLAADTEILRAFVRDSVRFE